MKYVKKLNGLEQALRSVEMFNEQSIKFATLHVAALIKVAELDGLKKLKGDVRKTAEWLFSLDARERETYIAMCGDGATIVYIWKHFIAPHNKQDDAFARLEQIKKNAISEVKDKGIIDLKPFQDEIKKIAPTGVANDVIDGIRNDMRKNGAVGVERDSGLYVMPLHTEDEQRYSPQAKHITSACRMRFESICNDISKLRELILKSNVQFSFQDCLSIKEIGHYWYNVDQFRTLLLLADSGIFKDSDDLESWINDSARWKSFRDDRAPKNGREYYLWMAKDYISDMTLEDRLTIRGQAVPG